MSMRVAIVGALAVAMSWQSVPADPPQPTTIDQILQAKSRWVCDRGLAAWDRPLTDDEIDELRQFAKDQKDKDWRLHQRARLVLGKCGPAADHLSDVERKGIDLLLAIRAGKMSPNAHDDKAEALAKLGAPAVPLLIDALNFTVGEDAVRSRVILRAMAGIDDQRCDAALEAALAKGVPADLAAQALRSLLLRDGSAERAESLARLIVARNSGFDEETIFRHIAQDEVPRNRLRQLYGHYNQFQTYGRIAIIRQLGQWDDLVSFELLRKAAARQDDAVAVAASVLTESKQPDASQVLLSILETDPSRPPFEVVFGLGRRGCRPAIPALKHAAKTSNNPAVTVAACAALCRLGVDYQTNAGVVRAALTQQQGKADHTSVYRVAGWLHDDATIQALTQCLIGTDAKGRRVLNHHAIQAMGTTGRVDAAPHLLALLTFVPDHPSQNADELDDYQAIGNALLAIGKSAQAEDLIGLGQAILRLYEWSRCHFIMQQAVQADEPIAPRRPVDQWLADHKPIVPGLVRRLRNGHGIDWPTVLAGMQNAWHPAAEADLQELAQNEPTVQSLLLPDGRVVKTAPNRSAIAKYLADKTGKPCSFTDPQGVQRPAGWQPQ